MNTLPRIEGRLLTLFRERMHIDVPATDMNLFETGVLDSLRVVELLLALERDLGLRLSFDDIDLERLASVASIAVLVRERAPHAGSEPSPALHTTGETRNGARAWPE